MPKSVSADIVSVVIPAFNTESTVGAAIESALHQEDVTVEVLVTDDGSSDGTRRVVEAWSRKDPRVRSFANVQSEGSSSARNVGLRAARGQFIAFLDSDDVWLPGFLRTQLRAFDEFPDAAVITGNAVSVGGPMDGMTLRPPSGGRRRISLLDMVEHEDAVNIMSVFRREVFDTIGGFDVALRRSEDYEFWLRAAAAGFVFVQTPEPLVRYLRRPGSVSSDELKMYDAIVFVLARVRDRWGVGPIERAAIERKIAELNRRAIALRAKNALRSREFGSAAIAFQQLYECDRRLSRALLAAASRFAPRTLWWADRLRRSVAAS